MLENSWLDELIDGAVLNFKVGDNYFPASIITIPTADNSFLLNLSMRDYIKFTRDVVSSKVGYFYPIVLTESILEKTKFKRRGSHCFEFKISFREEYSIKLRHKKILLERRNNYWCLKHTDSSIERHIKYFSELQYFISCIPWVKFSWCDCNTLFPKHLLFKMNKDKSLDILPR